GVIVQPAADPHERRHVLEPMGLTHELRHNQTVDSIWNLRPVAGITCKEVHSVTRCNLFTQCKGDISRRPTADVARGDVSYFKQLVRGSQPSKVRQRRPSNVAARSRTGEWTKAGVKG